MTAAEPTDFALVVAAHGDRAGTNPNSILLGHCDALRQLGAADRVFAGVLNGEPTLEEALESAARSGARHVAVYPFFMSKGHFAGTVLPQRIEASRVADKCTLLTPLGLDPRLPVAMLAEALDAAAAAGLDPDSSRLLVAGHGSRGGRASAEATEAIARSLADAGLFAEVATAYLEEEPYLLDRLNERDLPTVVAGFFSGEGLHGGEDVPRLIAKSGANVAYSGAIGRSRAVPDIIWTALSELHSVRA